MSEKGSVAEYTLDRLHEWGIDRIYGYPGDGINGFIGAFQEAGDKVRFIQTRHEEIAAFAATAHAKLTGQVGVCMATSGPGAIHLLNGLYDAKLDHQPVVAIIGQQKTFSLGTNYQQEVDLNTLFKDVASEFVQTCASPHSARHLIDRAMRIAQARRSVTCVIFPSDIQEEDYSDPPAEHGAVFSSVGFNQPRIVPRDDDLRAAAEVLNGSQKVAMLIGQGAAGAADEVIETANKLGCGVAKALNGRAALPDDLPFVTGSVGLLGTKPSYEMIMNCDALFMIGTSFPYAEWLPPDGAVKAVQIDIDAGMIGARYPLDATLVGDARETLRALLPQLEHKEDRAWREQIESGIQRWWRILADQADIPADPVNPQYVFHELSPRLPERCILTADSGSATDWWARHLKVQAGMKAALSGTLATMCPAVPYAVAAKFAYPDRPVIAALGDGAMQMLGINALVDLARYWPEWSDPRCIVLVLNNHDLNQVTWEQRVLAGDPRTPATQDLPDFPFARYGELLGLKGIRVDAKDQVSDAWDEALAADRPVVFEAVTDPNVPPLPPHIKLEQARKMGRAMLESDEDRFAIAKQSAKGKLQELINR